MAISLSEPRLDALVERDAAWRPFGILHGFPPSMEMLEEEYGSDGVARRGGHLRRSHSWSGYTASRARKAFQKGLPQPSSAVRDGMDGRCAAAKQPKEASRCSTKSSGRVSWATLVEEEEEARSWTPCSESTTASTEDLSLFEEVAPQMQGGRRNVSVPAPGDQPGVTTYMVQNLSRTITRRGFLDVLDDQGFAGWYDFAHLPKTFGTGRNKGFAFVNFLNEDVARRFAARYPVADGSKVTDRVWRVAPADVQGFHANAVAAGSRKMTRVRNSACRPLLVEGHGVA